ncbi:tetratricopeptide repeat protein [Winogradskyella eximia]|uniref:Tetratricopeptide repeat protein n=1 Tax=Winogradskyella eximia TaxID=262006 RepID=A0A3D9HBG6_9FLAO|nr:histidine kinase [Winogradskyella eximia]RED46818.1 tetratricopeptide repeat protein [Winogradskyella eximia]
MREKDIRSMTYRLHISLFFFYLLAFTSSYSLNVANFTICASTNLYKNKIISTVQDSAKIELKNKIDKAANDSLKIASAYFEYGQYLNNSGEKEASIDYLKLAIKIANKTSNKAQIAEFDNYLANVYWQAGIYQSSIDTYILAYKSAAITQDSSQMAKISMNLASNYNYLGDYNEAIKYALNALKIKETAKDWERICYHYVAMATIFKETDNVEKWDYYIQKAYKLKDVENCASFGDIAKIYNNLGSIAVRKGNHKKALIYFDSLLVLSKQAGFDKGISAALGNSSNIYKELNQPEKALELLLESEKYFGDPYEIISNNNSKAELYRLLGQEQKALDLVMKNTSLNDLRFYSMEHENTLSLLSDLNADLLNYKAALKWNDSLRILENKLRDDKVRKGIEELETKYETAKKEQQIELLTAENELKNQGINTGIAIVSFLVTVIILILYIVSIRNKQAELKQNNLRLQVLRTQMNPHFVFNALGSIQNFMLKNDARKASQYLSQFASLTRATLNNSTAETISLADEISMLKNYMALEKMRKQNKFIYSINYDDDLDLDFIRIPPMLNQPFIENAIKHGFKNIDNGGILEITITDKKDWVEFIIEDNGEGFPEGKIKGGYKSMAMSIFENRRKLIRQKYKKDFKFEILNLNDEYPNQTGVRITINIPILNND